MLCDDGTFWTSYRSYHVSNYHGETSGRFNKTSWRCTTETTSRRSTETPLCASFEIYLLRRWDVQIEVATTSPRRLVASWVESVLTAVSENCQKI